VTLIARRTLLKAAAGLPVLGARAAFAQQYPSRTIKIIVPASAGTSIDAAARHVADALAKQLNTSVLVDNRPGAGGLLGYQAAAKSAPDGYTLILTGLPLYLLPIFSELAAPPFDPLRDFTPVARILRVPLAIVVAADSPYRTMGDLVQAMKSKPDELTYSSQGVGSTAHLCSVLLTDMSKTKARHISYKETTTAITDVAGGRVSFTCQGSAGVLALHQAGKVRIVAVTGAKRWETLPDVPTVAESAVPGFDASSQLDFMAPAQTPEPVVQLLSRHIVQIANSAPFKEFCAKQVLLPDPVGASALAPEITREAARWKKIAQLARTG
jgi:tripartite-type tricarboxylate transporter receptor subunit TctC